jgi:exosortase
MSSHTLSTAPSRGVVNLWLGTSLVALAVLFGPTLMALVRLWASDPNYSHGFLVLPLSLWLAWGSFRETGLPAEGRPALGAISLLGGCLAHLAALVLQAPLLDFVGLALVLRGLAVTVGGPLWAGRFTFPILFLFFLFPLPGVWTARAAVWLQDVVAGVSGAILDLFIVCHRQGNVLHLAGLGQPLVVAQECSGLRQIVAFIALGTLLGHLGGGRPLPRLLLLLAAIPVAILANTIRVLLMGFGAHFFGVGWISGPLHHAPALFSLPLGIALYLMLWWVVQRREASSQAPRRPGEGEEKPPHPQPLSPTGREEPDRRGGEDPSSPTPLPNGARGEREDDPSPQTPLRGGEGKKRGVLLKGPARRVFSSVLLPLPEAERGLRRGVSPLFIATTCLTIGVVAQIVLLWHLKANRGQATAELRAPLAKVPLKLIAGAGPKRAGADERAAWHGQDLSPVRREELARQIPFADEFIYRFYQAGKTGPVVTLYAVHSRKGEDRKHHPEVCVRDVAGAPEDEAARKKVSLGGENRFAQRFRFRTGTGRYTVIYYWYYTLSGLPPAGESTLQEFHRRTGHPPSVTVQVSTTAVGNELDLVERSFLPALDRVLQQDQLPPAAAVGCDRLPVTLIGS